MSYISYCLQTLQGLTNSILTLLSWMTNYLSFRYIRLGHRSLPRTEDQGKIYVSSSQYTPVTLYHFCKAVNHCIICNYVFSQTLISRHIIRMQFFSYKKREFCSSCRPCTVVYICWAWGGGGFFVSCSLHCYI